MFDDRINQVRRKVQITLDDALAFPWVDTDGQTAFAEAFALAADFFFTVFLEAVFFFVVFFTVFFGAAFFLTVFFFTVFLPPVASGAGRLKDKSVLICSGLKTIILLVGFFVVDG